MPQGGGLVPRGLGTFDNQSIKATAMSHSPEQHERKTFLTILMVVKQEIARVNKDFHTVYWHTACNIARGVRCIRRPRPALTGAQLLASELPQNPAYHVESDPVPGRPSTPGLAAADGVEPPGSRWRATGAGALHGRCASCRLGVLGLQRASEAVQPMFPKGVPQNLCAVHTTQYRDTSECRRSLSYFSWLPTARLDVGTGHCRWATGGGSPGSINGLF